MKLRQKEYCHNCGQDVIFEFDDEVYRQTIYCPVCGHPHLRELDEGTIVNIRMNTQIRDMPVIHFAKMPPLNLACTGIDPGAPVEYEAPQIETRRVLGEDEGGNMIIETKEGERFDSLSGNVTRKVVSQRRWGSANIG